MGLSVAMAWRMAGWQNALYEGMPGILAGLAVLILTRWFPIHGKGAEQIAD
jgi:hypothetical protein